MRRILKGIFLKLFHFKKKKRTTQTLKSKCSLVSIIKTIQQLILFTSQIDLVTRWCAETAFKMHDLNFSMIVLDYFVLLEITNEA